MNRRTLIALATCAFFQGACVSRPAAVDPRLVALQNALGTELLTESAIQGLANEKDALDKLTREIETKADRKKSAYWDWEAGECQRLRHLFDEPAAWEECERRLSLALAREPTLARAHLSLGQLYLTGGFEMAPRAERAFVRALEEAGTTPLPAAHKGLFLAYYYQTRWAEALTEADRYLALVSADHDVKKMRGMAETNLKQKKEAGK